MIQAMNRTQHTGLLCEHSQSSCSVCVGTNLPFPQNPLPAGTYLSTQSPCLLLSRNPASIRQGSCEFQPPMELFSFLPTCRFMSHLHAHMGHVHRCAPLDLELDLPGPVLYFRVPAREDSSLWRMPACLNPPAPQPPNRASRGQNAGI